MASGEALKVATPCSSNQARNVVAHPILKCAFLPLCLVIGHASYLYLVLSVTYHREAEHYPKLITV